MAGLGVALRKSRQNLHSATGIYDASGMCEGINYCMHGVHIIAEEAHPTGKCFPLNRAETPQWSSSCPRIHQTCPCCAVYNASLNSGSILAKWLMGVTLRVAAENPGDEHAACLGSKGMGHVKKKIVTCTNQS